MLIHIMILMIRHGGSSGRGFSCFLSYDSCEVARRGRLKVMEVVLHVEMEKVI